MKTPIRQRPSYSHNKDLLFVIALICISTLASFSANAEKIVDHQLCPNGAIKDEFIVKLKNPNVKNSQMLSILSYDKTREQAFQAIGIKKEIKKYSGLSNISLVKMSPNRGTRNTPKALSSTNTSAAIDYIHPNCVIKPLQKASGSISGQVRLKSSPPLYPLALVSADYREIPLPTLRSLFIDSKSTKKQRINAPYQVKAHSFYLIRKHLE